MSQYRVKKQIEMVCMVCGTVRISPTEEDERKFQLAHKACNDKWKLMSEEEQERLTKLAEPTITESIN